MALVAGERVYPPLLAGFAGESRSLAENLLPPQVSPDALNIDYRDGTLRKRRGVGRLSRHAALGGGLWVQGTGGLASASGVSLSGTLHTYECVVQPRFVSVGASYRAWLHVSSGSDGTALWIVNDAGTYKYQARVKHSGGTLSVTGAAAANGTARSVTVSFDTATKTLRLVVGGAASGNTDDDDTIGAETYTQPGGVVRFGGESTADDSMGCVVSDFRLWGGTVASSLQDNLRALLASEVTAALLAWWRFLQAAPLSDSTGNGETLSAGGHFVGGFVPGADTYDDIDVVVSANFSGAWYLVMVGTRGTIYTGQMRANTVMSVESLVGNYGPVLGRGPFRMQGLAYREWIVFCNGYGENTAVRWAAEGGMQLSYEAPTASSAPTATAAGSGGDLSAGVYRYQYTIYNSTTGVESAVGLFTSSVTAASSDEVTIDFTTGSFMPSRYFPGADTIRIYRTLADGVDFWFLDEVSIDATSYVDDAADATLSTLLDSFTGYAAPSRFGFEMDDRLWLGNQSGFESRLVYTERLSLGAFFSDNFVDVGAGDGDVLTGGYGAGDRAVAFKRRSTWLVAAFGGDTQVVKLAAGVGCVQHATIASAHNALYWLGEGGIYRMALPLGGGAPESVTGDAWREFFQGFTDADYENCSGVWDAFNERYILSMKMGEARKVLVYTTRNQALALWDVDASGFVLLSGGGTNKVFCGWRGYLSEFNTGLNDGGNPHATAHAAVGTVTGGTAETLTDSAATWTAVSTVANGRLSGLQGLDVRVADADGGNVQVRRVVWNTGTVLTVDAAWDVTPSSGWTYMLGAIEGRWRSALLSYGDWSQKKNFDRVRVLNRVPEDSGEASSAVTFYVEPEGESARRVAKAHGMGVRFSRYGITGGLCREVVVGVEDVSADGMFDVAGIGVSYVERNNDD